VRPTTDVWAARICPGARAGRRRVVVGGAR